MDKTTSTDSIDVVKSGGVLAMGISDIGVHRMSLHRAINSPLLRTSSHCTRDCSCSSTCWCKSQVAGENVTLSSCPDKRTVQTTKQRDDLSPHRQCNQECTHARVHACVRRTDSTICSSCRVCSDRIAFVCITPASFCCFCSFKSISILLRSSSSRATDRAAC